MVLLEGKTLAHSVQQQLKEQVTLLKTAGRPAPLLAAVLVGNDPSSEVYISSKIKSCRAIGYQSTLVRLSDTVSEMELLSTIKKLNTDSSVDAILVQLPLPPRINNQLVLETILPSKDVDGFSPVNMGKLSLGFPCILPATPYGILLLLAHYKIETIGRHVVVIGRSNIVGRPLSILLSSNIGYGNATVTLCYQHTQDLKMHCRLADIIVVAAGSPNLITPDMVKPQAVVIDVGINKVNNPSAKRGYDIVGDADFKGLQNVVSAITPVPGGVGLMTIAALMLNTLKAYQLKHPPL